MKTPIALMVLTAASAQANEPSLHKGMTETQVLSEYGNPDLRETTGTGEHWVYTKGAGKLFLNPFHHPTIIEIQFKGNRVLTYSVGQ